MTLTTNQIALVFSVLVLGWLLGLLTLSGGRARRRQLEARNRELAAERDQLQSQLNAAHSRILEFERRPVTVPNQTVQSAVAPDAGATFAARPHSDGDDLTLINGIGRQDEARLNELGIHSYHQLAVLSDEDIALLEEKLGRAPGTIISEHWRQQADDLRHH